MHLLDHILKLVTLGSVIVGATAIYIALRNHSRQLGAQIFIAYTDRLLKLRRMLTIEANVYRLSWAAEEALTVAERHTLLEAFYLVFEFYELRRHSYITAEIWGIWAPDIKRLLCDRSQRVAEIARGIHHPSHICGLDRGRAAGGSAAPRTRHHSLAQEEQIALPFTPNVASLFGKGAPFNGRVLERCGPQLFDHDLTILAFGGTAPLKARLTI